MYYLTWRARRARRCAHLRLFHLCSYIYTSKYMSCVRYLCPVWRKCRYILIERDSMDTENIERKLAASATSSESKKLKFHIFAVPESSGRRFSAVVRAQSFVVDDMGEVAGFQPLSSVSIGSHFVKTYLRFPQLGQPFRTECVLVRKSPTWSGI